MKKRQTKIKSKSNPVVDATKDLNLNLNKTLSRLQKISNWFRDNWRSLAFITYFAICIFDFIIMPIVFQIFNNSVDPATLVQLLQQIKDPATQQEFLRLYGSKGAWVPLTMGAGGTFHMAFGGILTAASYTRGKEKIAMINQGAAPSPVPDNPGR